MMQGISRKTRHAVRRAKRRREVWMNIVSMIDILTVLVFFLLMNATGISILGLQLPSANAAQSQPPAHQLTVTLHDSGLSVADNGSVIGRFPRLQDGRYDLDGLSDLLLDIKQKLPNDDNIILLMDPTTPYNDLVAVMDTVKARPAENGPQMIPLFPQISLGDAPATDHAATDAKATPSASAGAAHS